MSSIYPLISTFNRGEISPLLASRVDIDSWRQSLAYCRNFHILTHGGLRRRSGSRFIAELKNSAEVARLLPFKFSETQSYILAMNGGVFRFYALRGVLGAPYELAHPWTQAELPRLSYDQFNDVGYFAHRARQPSKLSRHSDTNWSIEALTFKDGPYLPSKTEATKLIPASTGLLGTAGVTSAGTTGSLEIIGAGVSNAYTVAATVDDTATAPASWTIEGYDGSGWTSLDSRSGQVGWTRGEVRFFSFINTLSFLKYRISWNGNNGAGSTIISPIRMNESGDTMTPFSLSASSVAGINNGSGFLASDVGRSIRIMGSDGKWRWAQVTSLVSAYEVKIRLYGYALPNLSPIAQWRLGAWSMSSGFPAVVSLFDERLMFARTDTQPVTLWGSKQGSFDDFGSSDPVLSTDGLSLTLLSSNMNEINWLSSEEEIIAGSAGQIRSVGPADTTQAFSATNFAPRKGPTSGADAIEPLSIGGVTLYVAQGGKKIRELVVGEQNRYVAPELTIFAEHMLKAGVKDWSFVEKPDPTVWAVTNDGLVTVITYDRDQKTLGFARHDFGGVVENVAVVPGVEAGVDDVYLVVRRTIDGQTKRYLEVLERPFDGDTDTIEDSFFVDCGLSYSGAPITTVTGLAHLEGQEVVALADGGAVHGLTVTAGAVTLPYSASRVHVGLPFKSRAVTLPYYGPGQDGALFGRRVNQISAHVDVMATGALKVGSLGSDRYTPELVEQFMKSGDSLFGSALDLQSGFTRCDFQSSWDDGNGQIVMETDEPLPALIRSLALQTESEP